MRKNDFIKIENNVIYIDGLIDASLFNGGDYTFLDFKNDVKNIKGKIIVEINTMGGHLQTALSIYDFFRSLDNKIITKITSTSASAGTIISLSGDRRYIHSNSRYMIHLPAVMLQSHINSEQMEDVLNEMKDLDDQLIKLYVNRTKLSYDDVLNLMKNERFINAQSAIEMGFVDDIIRDKNDYEKEIYNDMDNKLFKLFKVKSDDEVYSNIINLLDENQKLKKLTDLSKGGASLVNENPDEKEDEKVEAQADTEKEDEKVEAQADTEKEDEKVENEADEKPDEKVEAQADTEKEDEKVENEADENGDDAPDKDAEIMKLLEKIAELEKLLADKENQEIENKKIALSNYLKEQLTNNVITNETYDNWVDIGKDKGLDFVKNMISNLPVRNEKISTYISNLSNLSQKELKEMWKKGQLDGSTYLNLKK